MPEKNCDFCIALDYRPIALLNSDYKLFTKILSFRVRPLLSHIVLPAQVGLVPKRSIRTSLDIFKAVHNTTRADSDMHGDIVLLLVFAKAYDTLQHPYLLYALKCLGFSSQLIPVAAALHHSTTCQFVVNGYCSLRREVNCGIWQRCPLTPLLFTLALDNIYRVQGAANLTSLTGSIAISLSTHGRECILSRVTQT